MNSKYNASMSFTFVNGGNEYTYDGSKCEVSGAKLRDAIKYIPESVDRYLRNGQWQVIIPTLGFPRAGVYAKLDGTTKVYIVGPSTLGHGWVVELNTGAISKVKATNLTEISNRDDRAFAISIDLGVSFHQALKMIDKGYGKL